MLEIFRNLHVCCVYQRLLAESIQRRQNNLLILSDWVGRVTGLKASARVGSGLVG